MSLVLQSSGGGSVTIAEPTTASNFTQNLPAATGTVALLQTPSFATTIGVGGATASASGAGITFPSTQSASSDANTLDDYEEGTWTPAWNFSTSGSVTLSISGATYTKVGRLVTIQCRIFTTAISSPSGNATIIGLPFTNSGTEISVALGPVLRFNNDLPNLKGFVTGSAATISLQTQATNSASETSLTGANISGTAGNYNIIGISASYFI
jgi:hypothetical protein